MVLSQQPMIIKELTLGTDTATAYTFPSADGANTEILSTDGAGALSFVAGGGGGAATEKMFVHGSTKATAIVNTWVTHVLDIEDSNTITGASLATNQITLPAGTYTIKAIQGGYATLSHQIGLYNTTDAAFIAYGMNAYNQLPVADYSQTTSQLNAHFTLAAEKDLELQGIVQNVGNFGQPHSASGDWATVPQHYVSVVIIKEP